MKPLELVGRKFGLLYVLARTRAHIQKRSWWLCRCDCGTWTIVLGRSLTSGNSQSCGCAKTKAVLARVWKHGWAGEPTYRSWKNMRQRCRNTNNPRYKDYGGRGISVCERWDEFKNFLVDMGRRPDGKTLDRINNDGRYEPLNCRWASYETQANNRRLPRR